MTDVDESAHEATELEDRRIALLISVLALLLAFAETGSKSTQTEVLAAHVEASDLWAFYQAKTIRETVLQTAEETVALSAPSRGAGASEPAAAQIDAWRASIARLQSDPKTGEGRKELSDRARQHEGIRDVLLSANHKYEVSAAAFQIAIVLASASVITEVVWLTFLAGGLGVLGGAILGLAFFAPKIADFF